MRRPVLILFVLTSLGVASQGKAARADFQEISVHALSLAPNAGGQQAYRAEWYGRPSAWHGFYNKALTVGKLPLMGAGYNYRLSICDETCFWRFFTQIGGGMSNAGPYGEITWGTIIPVLPLWLPLPAPKFVPSIRLDISSQFYIAETRFITWSYPIWAGFSFAF